jgi:hypothetical protein
MRTSVRDRGSPCQCPLPTSDQASSTLGGRGRRSGAPSWIRDEEELKAHPEAYAEARALLRDPTAFAALLEAEIRLLGRLGVDESAVDRIRAVLRDVKPPDPSDASFVNSVGNLRDAACDLKDAMIHGANYDGDTAKIWGAALGLSGVALAAASAPLVAVAPPIGIALETIAGGLIAEGLRRAFG